MFRLPWIIESLFSASQIDVLRRRGSFNKAGSCAVLAMLCGLSSLAAAQTRVSTATSLSVSSGGVAATSVTWGSTVTLLASISTSTGAAVPAGQVNFCDAAAKYCTDIHILGTAQLTNTGTAVLKMRPGIGSHSYKAVFLGTRANAASSSSTSSLTVTGTLVPNGTATTISRSGSWGEYNLGATVTEIGTAAPLTGTVSFLDASNGNGVLTTVPVGTSNSGWTWVNSQTPITGRQPYSIASGDFNGDGIPDLVVANSSGGSLSILLGKGDGTFTSSTIALASGATPSSVVVADFNEDGAQDIAFMDGSHNALNVLLGHGDGTFSGPIGTTLPAAVNPSPMVVGDFNNDGIPDLASPNGSQTVLLGNGDGTFTAGPVADIAGMSFLHVATGDFNGDGNADLVICGIANNNSAVLILLGNGDGTFTSGQSLILPSVPASIVAADFNGDGKLDFAVGNGNNLEGAPSTLDIFLGNGDGTFTYQLKSPVTHTDPSALAVGDFNGDGFADIVSSDYSINGGITVLLGNGDGTFTSVPGTPQTGSEPLNLAIADFDGDGRPDIAVANYFPSTVSVLLTEPTQTASTAPAAISLPVPGVHVLAASYSGDTNYNGSVSSATTTWGIPPATVTTLIISASGTPVATVAAGNAVTLTATVTSSGAPVPAGQVRFCDASVANCTDIHLLGTAQLTSNGTAIFRLVPGVGTHTYKAQLVQSGRGVASSSTTSTLTVSPPASVSYPTSTTIAQSGSAGNYTLTATVVETGATSPPIGAVSFLDTSYQNAVLGTIALGSGTPGLTWVNSQSPSTGAAPWAEATGDLNGDGIPDLVVTTLNSSTLTILLGNGDGTFRSVAGPNVGVGAYCVGIGDFNGDGKLDIAVGNNAGTALTILLGNGDGTFRPMATHPIAGGLPESIAVADLNGDGKPDLVVSNYSGPMFSILLGNGDGTFTPAPGNVPNGSECWSVSIGDYDGDGIPDLAVTSNNSTVTIFLGNGDGTFTQLGSPISVGLWPASIVSADLNGDGTLDLAVSNMSGGTVTILLGSGHGTFTQAPNSPISVGSSPSSITAGDFNQDGKPDLAVSNYYGNNITVLFGNGDGTFTLAATSPATGNAPYTIASADFDGDGVPDLATANDGASTTGVFLTRPTQTVTSSITGVSPSGPAPHQVVATYPGGGNYGASTSSTTSLNVQAATPVISPASGTFTSIQTVTITDATPGTQIYYTTNGVVPTTTSTPYTGPFVVSGRTQTVQAIAVETGYLQSVTATAAITLNLSAPPPPVFSLAPGIYPAAQTVTLSDPQPGVVIYYTTNGSFPTTSSPTYSGPISLSTSETLVAVAAYGYAQSSPASAQYYIGSSSTPFIYTIAGNSSWGYAGDGGSANFASLNSPTATALDTAGNIYIADYGNNVVRRVDSKTGVITTVAGTGNAGYSGDNGPATAAQLSSPVSLAIDGAGNIYVADYVNDVVRRIDAGTGIITTYAGQKSASAVGDGGPALNAQLSSPTGLALDAAGNLFISTFGNRIRMVTAGSGTITTVAGTGGFGYTGNNGSATSATLAFPEGIAVDGAGNIYIADTQNNVIREVNATTGVITSVAGTASRGYAGDGGPATSATLNLPYSVAVDTSGNLYIADYNNAAIRKVAASTGIISTLAGSGSCTAFGGDGGPAASAALCLPRGITVSSAGTIYVAETSANRVREITSPMVPPTAVTPVPVFVAPSGTYANPQTVNLSDTTPGTEIYLTLDGSSPAAAQSPAYYGSINVSGSVTMQAIAVAPGYLPSTITTSAYTITNPPQTLLNTVAGSGVQGASGAGGPANNAQFSTLSGIAVDSAGNLYIPDPNNEVVWKSSASTGTINIVVGTLLSFGKTGDGGPATSALLFGPSHVALDSAGNLYIADTNNNEIRRVDAQSGIISLYAGGATNPSLLGDGGPATDAGLSGPQGLAFDSADNLYIADLSHARIRMVASSTENISTVAGGSTSGLVGDGGPATSAALSNPYDVTISSNGDMYIADSTHGLVRRVAANTTVITTVAGNGDVGASGDGGPATQAEINPRAVAVDRAGNLYIANPPDAVREVSATTGLITTVVGNGYIGFSGDGGSATLAELCDPSGLALDQAGGVYIAEQCNYRVRKMSFASAAAAPVFSLTAGSYAGSQTVTISDATANTTIYYTTDGSVPGTASSVYTGSISVASTETLSAIAVATGYNYSAVTTAAYSIKPSQTPQITWPTPASISFGVALSSRQLNASTTVPGTFTYSPGAGTMLTAGQHTLTATFSPSDTTHYAVATATVTLTVTQATPAIAWEIPPASANPIFVSNSVTFIAQISSSAGTPTGTVNFYDGDVLLGPASITSGAASYTSSSLAVGSHFISASYSGDTNFTAITSVAFTETVEDFTVTAPPGSSTSATVAPGGQADYSLAVALPGGPSANPITFSITGLPPGATATFSPASLPANSGPVNVTLTVNLPATASLRSREAPFADGTFAIALGLILIPFTGRLSRSSRSLFCLVAMACLLVGLSGCGGKGSGSTTSTPPGTYTLTVSATSGVLKHSTTFTLTVSN